MENLQKIVKRDHFSTKLDVEILKQLDEIKNDGYRINQVVEDALKKYFKGSKYEK